MAASVLVVDDDDDVRSLLVLQLTLSGYEPREAATVEEGLALLAQEPPDLVITDLNFGTDSGERILSACHERGVPVMLMTASVELGDLTDRLGQEVRILKKPFTLDALAAAIEEMVQS